MRAATSITVRVPLAIRHRPGRKTVVTPEGVPAVGQDRMPADPAMLKALARAFRWKRMLEGGRYASISEIATAEKIDRGYVGSILRLTLLAPDIVEAILDGRQLAVLSLPALLKPFSPEWNEQRRALSAGGRITADAGSSAGLVASRALLPGAVASFGLVKGMPRCPD